jgi:hypothetical protein
LSPKDKCLPAVSALGFQSPGTRPGVARMPQDGASGANEGKILVAFASKRTISSSFQKQINMKLITTS